MVTDNTRNNIDYPGADPLAFLFSNYGQGESIGNIPNDQSFIGAFGNKI